MESPAPSGNAKRRPKWANWLGGALIALNLCVVLSFLGAFSPLFSPLIYPQLAPTGWNNATPHGHIILFDFAVSTTTPGLMAACGGSLSVDIRDPRTWNFGLRYWLSHDGGATWQGVHPPLAGGAAYCEVALEPDGSIAFTNDYGQIQNGQYASTSTWVTRNSGKSWQRPAADPTVTVDGQPTLVTPLVPRAGVWYGLYDTHDAYGDEAFAISADDGSTWQPLGTAPSALVKQGWRASDFFVQHEFVPDYRGDHSWYRVLYADSQAPVVEHSMDDGHSWAAVGPIGSEFRGLMSLAVNPAQPGQLCADSGFTQTDHLELRSSVDGGQTWQGGAMPLGYLTTVGVTSIAPVMDAEGSCYTGYHYGLGGPQYQGNDGSYCAVMRLSPGSDTLEALPLGGYCELPNGDPVDLTYVSAANGLPGRLVIEGSIANGGWVALAGGLAGETDGDKVIWKSVP